MSYQEDLPETSGYSKVSVVISAIVGLVLVGLGQTVAIADAAFRY